MTRWHSDPPPPATTHDLQLARLAAIGIALSLLESAIPSPLPGIKPGLANIVTLIALHQLGWRAAAWVSLLRIVGAGVLLGSLFTPGFWLSLAGPGQPQYAGRHGPSCRTIATGAAMAHPPRWGLAAAAPFNA